MRTRLVPTWIVLLLAILIVVGATFLLIALYLSGSVALE